jgi:SAM-dependent methyltransferase
MESPASFPYDTVAYPGLVHPQSHPAAVAPKALLFGLDPAPPTACRVLELGCGNGLNLAAMAAAHPHCRYVGVDLSGEAIARGRRLLDAAGIAGVDLRQGSLTEVDASWGEFDYVIVHGVYSWVPDAVRDAILPAIGSVLAPEGVAFLSCLAYPGAHLREITRTIARLHTREIPEPERKSRETVGLIGFLSQASAKDGPYQHVLEAELESVRTRGDDVLFHDELSEYSTPRLFVDLVAEAGRSGLQFLADSEYVEPAYFVVKPEAWEALKPLAGNRILLEQYIDFIQGRRFRQALFCRSGRPLRLDRSRVARCLVAMAGEPESLEAADPASPTPLRINGKGSSFFIVTDPLAKAFYGHAGALRPRRLSYAEALVAAQHRLGRSGPPSPSEEAELQRLLVRYYAPGLSELHISPAPFGVEPGRAPRTSPLVRAQIALGHSPVTSLTGRPVEVPDPLGRFLLLSLDGSRTLEDLEVPTRTFLEQEWSRASGTPDCPRPDDPALLEHFRTAVDSMAENALFVRDPSHPS